MVNDGNFSREALINRINADLANDLGNLLHRSLNMIGRFNDGLLPALTGWMRLAILVTVFWIAGWAAYLQPWKSCNYTVYLYIALSPAVATWGAFWVWSGCKPA